MTPFSKGKWVIDTDPGGCCHKETVIYCLSSPLAEPICIVPHDDVTKEGRAEIEANIRLICQAQGLFSTLHRFCEIVERQQPIDAALYNKAVRLLKKIAGEKK
jgi:hypothetical protein